MNRGRIRIKVCGITRLEDALCAASAGVDALGFIFYRKSPRYIDPEEARQIIDQLPPFIDTVGVFVDQEREEVEEIIHYCRLGYVQLHGQEPPKYCERLLRASSPCQVIKAFRVGPHTTAEEFEPYVPYVKAFLLDTYDKEMAGGTGRSFDWSLIDMLRLARPCRRARRGGWMSTPAWRQAPGSRTTSWSGPSSPPSARRKSRAVK